nr:3704_t:CDS:2 [Entrophospora candida]
MHYVKELDFETIIKNGWSKKTFANNRCLGPSKEHVLNHNDKILIKTQEDFIKVEFFEDVKTDFENLFREEKNCLPTQSGERYHVVYNKDDSNGHNEISKSCIVKKIRPNNCNDDDNIYAAKIINVSDGKFDKNRIDMKLIFLKMLDHENIIKIDEIRKKFTEIEAENNEIKKKYVEVEAENTDLKEIIKENVRCEAESMKLKARVEELERYKKENEKRFEKLEEKQLKNVNNFENIVNVSDPVINHCIDTNTKSLDDDTNQSSLQREAPTGNSLKEDTYTSNIKSSVPSDQKKEQGLIQEISIKYQNNITEISSNNIPQNYVPEIDYSTSDKDIICLYQNAYDLPEEAKL